MSFRVFRRNLLWEALRTQGPQQVLRMSPLLTRAVTLWALFCLLGTELPLRAAALYWTGAVNGTWNPVTNWTTSAGSLSLSPGSLGGINDTFQFNATAVNGPQTVFLEGDQPANQLIFSNAGSTTLLGGTSGNPAANVLTLGGSGAAITLSAGAGPVTIGDTDATPLAPVNLLLGTLGAPLTLANNSASRFTVANSVSDHGGAGLLLTGSGLGMSTIAGAILTSGSLTKTGISRWTLAGTNTIGGSINLLGGVLRLTNPAAVGSGSLWIGGGTLELAGDPPVPLNINTVVSAANTITLDRRTIGVGATHSAGMISINNTTQTFATGGMVISGSARLKLDSIFVTVNGPTFRALNSYTQQNVKSVVQIDKLDGSVSYNSMFSGPGDFIISSSLNSF
jgi:autotransporter-associated beta strand protein